MLIYPIILPELRFVDKFDNPNRYADMNPSLHITESGTVKILVRRVNYAKFQDKNFVIYERMSNSVYALLTGTINVNGSLNLENFKITPI